MNLFVTLCEVAAFHVVVKQYFDGMDSTLDTGR